jgi:hypothetical protein
VQTRLLGQFELGCAPVLQTSSRGSWVHLTCAYATDDYYKVLSINLISTKYYSAYLTCAYATDDYCKVPAQCVCVCVCVCIYMHMYTSIYMHMYTR